MAKVASKQKVKGKSKPDEEIKKKKPAKLAPKGSKKKKKDDEDEEEEEDTDEDEDEDDDDADDDDSDDDDSDDDDADEEEDDDAGDDDDEEDDEDDEVADEDDDGADDEEEEEGDDDTDGEDDEDEDDDGADDDDEEDDDDDDDDDEEDDEEEVSDKKKKGGAKASSADDADWMFDETQAKKARASLAAQRASRFRPEVWVKDKVVVRFRGTKPVASIPMHSINKGSGKFEKHTCSGEHCRYCRASMGKSIVDLWEVTDFSKYETKDGKKVDMATKFFALSETRSEQVMQVAARYGGKLSPYKVEVTRSGKKATTLYSFWPLADKKGIPIKHIADSKEKALPRFTKEDVRKYYSPLTPREQKNVVSQMEAAGGSQDDN